MQRGGPVLGGGQAENGAERAGRVSEVAVLRARCRRQALAIDKLRAAVSVLRAGAGALKAENADLRSEHNRRRGVREAASAAGLRAPDPRRVEKRLAADDCAAAAARALVADCLSGRVSERTVERAQLVISELVANSLRHAGAPPGHALVVRVAFEDPLCRLEVEDRGSDGAIAPRAPDLKGGGGGLGLNIVHTFSERWGIERGAGRGTRVWAYLAEAPAEHGQQQPGEVLRVAADV
jgi:anti-sigma regulatory factor (Ser/Thr protein kinase)